VDTIEVDIYNIIFKKMDSISYVYISLNYTRYVNDLHNIWKRRSKIFSNTTARALA